MQRAFGEKRLNSCKRLVCANYLRRYVKVVMGVTIPAGAIPYDEGKHDYCEANGVRSHLNFGISFFTAPFLISKFLRD